MVHIRTSSYYRKILMIISYSDMQALPWLFLCIYVLHTCVSMDFMFKFDILHVDTLSTVSCISNFTV